MSTGWELMSGGLAVLTLDQLSKAAALRSLKAKPLIICLGARLVLIRNRRGGFSCLTARMAGFLTVGIIASLLVIAGNSVLQTPLRVTGLACIIGGAAGNLVDRISRGAVIDFITISCWPTFNLADAALCIGFALTASSLL
ncbi:MAG: lspA [Bradyrhizobium sp.]|nr:lspA [Bradyrhizobium sp.]